MPNYNYMYVAFISSKIYGEDAEYQQSHRIRTYSSLEVIKLEYSLKLKIKRNDWLLADTYLQAANQGALFCIEIEN